MKTNASLNQQIFNNKNHIHTLNKGLKQKYSNACWWEGEFSSSNQSNISTIEFFLNWIEIWCSVYLKRTSRCRSPSLNSNQINRTVSYLFSCHFHRGRSTFRGERTIHFLPAAYISSTRPSLHKTPSPPSSSIIYRLLIERDTWITKKTRECSIYLSR